MANRHLRIGAVRKRNRRFQHTRFFVEHLESRSLLSITTLAMDTDCFLNATTTELTVAPEGEATTAQYQVNHPPRLQLGNAPLAGFPGSDRDQVELLWQTIPAGLGTQDSFTVEFRPVDSIAWSKGGSIATINTGVEGRIIHSSTLRGLHYDSDYEYRVQHLRAGSPIATYQATFHTRLPANSTASFTFAAYGDSADPSRIDGFRSVQNRINQVAPDFALLLGDNVYEEGTHVQSDARFDPTISPEAAQWNARHIDYATIGNHETRDGSKGKPYEEMFSLPIPVKGLTSAAQPVSSERPEHNYSFDYGNVHFLTFDSNSEGSETRLNNQLIWAEQDLKASKATWKIVFAHHPVGGSPDKLETPADNYYRQVVPRLRAAGVDLFLVGHSHTYSRTYPLLDQINGEATIVLDGDNDYAQGAGLIQLVSGVGGVELRGGDFNQFPFVVSGWSSSAKRVAQFGFAKVEVTPSRLTIQYVAASGAVLDTFTISRPATSPNNARPVANSFAVSTPANTAVAVTLQATDAESDPLTFSVASQPTSGTLTGTGANLVYTPNAAFVGTDSFTYRANDGKSNSLDATVSITVTPSGEGAGDTTISFQNGVFPTSGYSGTDDTKIRGDFPTTLRGTAKRLEVDGNPDMAALLRWNISQIPVGAEIQSASISVNILDTSSDLFHLYELRQPWNEGTASYNEFDTARPWQTAGVQGTNDRGSTVLGTLTGATAGRATIELNTAGVAMVQRWVNDPASNFGLIIQNYANDATNDLSFTSSEGSNSQLRPKLTIHYTPASTLRTASQMSGMALATGGMTFFDDALPGASALPLTDSAPLLTNPANPYDVNGDSVVSPNDALIVMNRLSRRQVESPGSSVEGNRDLVLPSTLDPQHSTFLDVSGDGELTPLDALLVINLLSRTFDDPDLTD